MSHGRTPAIEVSGLTKRYGKTLAVDDLSFSVPAGQVTGFLGPNGAGKSTAMRLMLGLDHGEGASLFAVPHGRAPLSSHDGPSVRHATRHSRSGLAPRPYRELPDPLRTVGASLETRAYHPRRSARAHLAWIAAGAELSPGRVDEVLDLVGLSEVSHERPAGFSLGMSQRFGLAVALLGDPAVLMLDEPANGLDPQGMTWLRKLLRQQADRGCAVFVSSHQLPELQLMADRVVVVGRGRLVHEGSVESFLGAASAVVGGDLADLGAREASDSLRWRVRVTTPDTERLTHALRVAGAQVRAAGVVEGNVGGVADGVADFGAGGLAEGGADGIAEGVAAEGAEPRPPADVNGEASRRGSGTLEVAGLTAAQVGDLAFEAGIRVHGLTAQTPSLEEAFIALTKDDVQFKAEGQP